MKKIIWATDFSDTAWNALLTAVKMYADLPCEFIFLHAFDSDQSPGTELPEEKVGPGRRSMKRLEELAEYLRREHPNPKHSYAIVVENGSLIPSLQKLAARENPDLIAVGATGITGAKKIFIGSNTLKMLQQVHGCSILAVPESHYLQRIKKVVFATDYSRPIQKVQLLPLLELVENWGAAIDVLYVSAEPGLNQTQYHQKTLLKRLLGGSAVTFTERHAPEEIAGSIQRYLEAENADLLTFIRYPHTFWEKMIRQSVVKGIAFTSTIPFLAMQH